MKSRRVVSTLTGLSALLAGLAGVTSAGSADAAGSAATAAASSVNNIRVGSFNVFGVNADRTSHGEQRRWRVRRPVVVSQILGYHLDVVGVQEANQSTIYRSGLVSHASNQYMDLLAGLNAKGGHYRVTNNNAYNCARTFSHTNCRSKYQGASGDTRIMYDTDTVSMVSQGSYRYRAQSGVTTRYLSYAVLRWRATGQKFLFTNTHLDPHRISSRVAEWRELVAKVNRLKGSLPVITVGDFNSTKFDSYTKEMLPKMKNNGYGDVLSQRFEVNPPAYVRARSVTKGWVNSFGAFRRNVKRFSYYKDQSKIGNNIDWIFASNNLTVKEWKMCLNVNPTTMRLRGVIPSDHNLVRAIIALP
jgi:endonuclease/exonuclease/phosphatase family metal-dependent hydrolase